MSPGAAVPEQDLSRLRDLVRAVSARYAELADLVDPSWSVDPAVVIDEAEELRRQLQAAAGSAHELATRARQPGPSAPSLTSVPSAPLSVAASAASLDAAACAIRPLSTGLRRDEHLARIAQASCRATGRFLRSAIQSVDQLDGRGQEQRPGATGARVSARLPLAGSGTKEPENPTRGRPSMTEVPGRERQEPAVEQRAARAAQVRHAARLHQAQLQQGRDDLATGIAEDRRTEVAQEVRP